MRCVTNSASCTPSGFRWNASTTPRQLSATGHACGRQWRRDGVSNTEQLGQSLTRIGRAHESLAHQKGVDIGGAHAPNIGAREDATLGYQEPIVGDINQQA